MAFRPTSRFRNLATSPRPWQAPATSADLIYLDPPFSSSATFNVLFKEKSGDHPLVPSLLRRGNRGGWQ